MENNIYFRSPIQGMTPTLERPPHVAPAWCPICDAEMDFHGIQRAGCAQFFCEGCRYRHDRFVGKGRT